MQSESPPPTARVTESECATSSEKDEDSDDQHECDEEEEGNGDSSDGAESVVEEGEEWYDRESEYERAEWEYGNWEYEREAEEYERKDEDGHNLEDEDNAQQTYTVNAVVDCGNIQSHSETPQTSTMPSVTRAVDDSESASTSLPSHFPINIDAPYESQCHHESSTQDPGLEAGEL
jgi:hypothetical protein